MPFLLSSVLKTSNTSGGVCRLHKQLLGMADYGPSFPMCISFTAKHPDQPAMHERKTQSTGERARCGEIGVYPV